MRLFIFPSVAATVLAIASCGQGDQQIQQSPSVAPAPPAAPAISITPINDIMLEVTVVGRPAEGDTSGVDQYLGSSSPLRTGTVAVLNESGGSQIRLIDDVRSGPAITKQADGSYTLIFRYKPEYGHGLATHDVREINRVISVGTRYAGLLQAVGLPLDSAHVSRLALSLNGRDMGSRDVQGPIADDGADFQTLDVSAWLGGASVNQ